MNRIKHHVKKGDRSRSSRGITGALPEDSCSVAEEEARVGRRRSHYQEALAKIAG